MEYCICVQILGVNIGEHMADSERVAYSNDEVVCGSESVQKSME
jgi:hypothetical protein